MTNKSFELLRLRARLRESLEWVRLAWYTRHVSKGEITAKDFAVRTYGAESRIARALSAGCGVVQGDDVVGRGRERRDR